MAEQTVQAPPPARSTRAEGKLSFGTKLAYGMGDFASQLMWSLASSYLVVFYTDNVGLAVGGVGVLMLVARVADALFDPMLGAFAERHPTRHGRFRPWLLYGSPILAVSVVLTFLTVPGGNTAKMVWAGVTYLVMGFMYSAVNLPYGALGTVMTRDPGERVALNSFRMIGTNLGSVLLSAITMPLVLRFSGVGDGQTTTVRGYTITATIMALIAMPMFWLVYAKCKEVIRPDVVATRVPLSTTLKVVLGNKPLMLVAASLFLSLTNLFGRLAVAIYYYIYIMERFDLIAWLMMLPSLTGAIGIALFARLAKRFGKRRTVIASLVITALPLFALYFTDPTNVPLVFVLTGLYGLGNFATPVIMSMVPDAIDYAEDRTGVRSDGTAYAAVSMATKIASAVGAALGAGLLGVFGYIANQPQTDTAAMGINFTVNVVPGLVSLLAIIPVLLYPITETKYEEIRASLRAKEEARESAA
ncbi:putative symporter YnaJ [Cellulomonas hominis]|uniref:GPH family glycoside/pentoside/hexuronide:cation symporter/probable glucitol transport protein GutA n=1 Tax=Cellulomonas hominis TaxID=156981 RepID=A0A511FC95_9CELL|nr:MFS transporter [Cellulomonas hominis]MBB5473134.1 GPH family glycoside/pentoside/hexuronide:cation symporter/probable glucitol transport protein GutA [Cellulomonas hominis]NKY05825.1 MFS transporter [Cellulomonas hominis]GEL45438.1 putative symporter YnaJ [Cellulomonas hominis]